MIWGKGAGIPCASAQYGLALSASKEVTDAGEPRAKSPFLERFYSTGGVGVSRSSVGVSVGVCVCVFVFVGVFVGVGVGVSCGQYAGGGR